MGPSTRDGHLGPHTHRAGAGACGLRPSRLPFGDRRAGRDAGRRAPLRIRAAGDRTVTGASSTRPAARRDAGALPRYAKADASARCERPRPHRLRVDRRDLLLRLPLGDGSVAGPGRDPCGPRDGRRYAIPRSAARAAAQRPWSVLFADGDPVSCARRQRAVRADGALRRRHRRRRGRAGVDGGTILPRLPARCSSGARQSDTQSSPARRGP